jgi:hypothetical protein
MTCYLLTPKGADAAAELTELDDDARPLTFDHQADAERHADHHTADGEPWRDLWTLYEVRPVS